MQAGICIETPAGSSVTQLVEQLRPLGRLEVARLPCGDWQIGLKDDSEEALKNVLEVVEGWLDTGRVAATKLHYRGHEYRMSSR